MGKLGVLRNAAPGSNKDDGVQYVAPRPVKDPEATTGWFHYDGSTDGATTELVDGEALLFGFDLSNASATDTIYVQFHNNAGDVQANDPIVDGEDLSFELPPNGYKVIEPSFFATNQAHFAAGLQIALSSTYKTYTAYGTPANVKGLILAE